MSSRRLRAWASALRDADERAAQERFIVAAIGVCLGALAIIVVEMVEHWPGAPATIGSVEMAGAKAGKDIAERIKSP